MLDRHALALTAARNLRERVVTAVPEDLGTWGPAWSLVEVPSREFLAMLDRYELASPADDGEEHALRREVSRAGARVMAAWKDAAAAWEAAGCPTDEPWTPDTTAPKVEAHR